MCGLCGLLQLPNADQPVSPELLAEMQARIAHRGPDDAASFLSPDLRVGLASRRLAILDLSPAGRMPMSTPDGRYTLVYNGEIYNYQEPRARLQAEGVQFRGHSDTEVILHLFARHGADCLRFLRGMFAIAIWDAQEKTLFLARDRIGEKPLYYTQIPGLFLFASEIKCLLAHPQVKRAVDVQAFNHFLTFLTTPAPDTLFQGIHKLPPAHYAFIHADGSLHLQEYWDVYDGSHVGDFSQGELVEQLRAKLRESVRQRMVSDVPFGVLLSGGIDSSTNTALMAEQMHRPVQTFSIGYKGAESAAYNEFEFARQVAKKFGADHHEVQIGAQDFLDFLPRLIYHQDEPIADPVCVPVYFVCELARKSGTTVVQVGEGADELFGGYRHWLADLRLHGGLWQTFGKIPRPAQQLAAGVARGVLSPVRAEYLRRASAGEELFWGGAIAFGETSKAQLLHPRIRQQLQGISSHDVVAYHRQRFLQRSPLPNDYLNWMSYLDLHLRLPELLLMRVDKMSMATSVEARVPFLDSELISLAMGWSQKQKLGDFQPKQLLKAAVRGIIPDEIIDRPKQGFRVPIQQWLKDLLGGYARQKLFAFCQRTEFLQWQAVEQLLHQHNELVWYLLNFVLWYELWLEGENS
jgi:asparagine synthase (glutamine-hydrolysing)